MYSTIIANVTNEPHATFTTADVGTVMGITPGTTNTLTATLNDAKGATGGAVVFTMINAVFENADTHGPARPVRYCHRHMASVFVATA